MLHFAFKLAAITSYLVLNIIVGDMIFVYIVVLILVALDFWVVKNITGRYYQY